MDVNMALYSRTIKLARVDEANAVEHTPLEFLVSVE